MLHVLGGERAPVNELTVLVTTGRTILATTLSPFPLPLLVALEIGNSHPPQIKDSIVILRGSLLVALLAFGTASANSQADRTTSPFLGAKCLG